MVAANRQIGADLEGNPSLLIARPKPPPVATPYEGVTIIVRFKN